MDHFVGRIGEAESPRCRSPYRHIQGLSPLDTPRCGVVSSVRSRRPFKRACQAKKYSPRFARRSFKVSTMSCIDCVVAVRYWIRRMGPSSAGVCGRRTDKCRAVVHLEQIAGSSRSDKLQVIEMRAGYIAPFSMRL